MARHPVRRSVLTAGPAGPAMPSQAKSCALCRSEGCLSLDREKEQFEGAASFAQARALEPPKALIGGPSENGRPGGVNVGFSTGAARS